MIFVACASKELWPLVWAVADIEGGRAFVALTADDNGIVKDGLVLRGFTVFARSKQLSAYTGFSINEIASGNRVAEGEKKKVQEAAVNSAQYILDHFERVKAGGE